MKIFYKISAITLILSIFTIASELVSFKSHSGVKETVKRLEETLGKNGLQVVSKMDMSIWAKKSGMDMNDEVVLSVGDPMSDARIMLYDARAALDLPMKIAVYRDFKGDTWVVYKSPQSYRNSYRLSKCSVLSEMDEKLSKSVKEAISVKIAGSNKGNNR